MRIFILALSAALLFIMSGSPSNALTLAITQCSIDKPIKDASGDFTQCPMQDEDNGLITKDHFNSIRLEKDVYLSSTPVFVHGKCRYIDASGTTNSVFIPFSSSEEWEAFLGNVPNGVTTTECCIPRVMSVEDVKRPTKSCSTAWKFEGLVSSSNHSVYMAKPLTDKFDAEIRMFENNALGSSLMLPIARDDIGTMSDTYTAKWLCANGTKTTGSYSRATVTTSTESLITAEPLAEYVDFQMQCKDADWTNDNGSCVDSSVQKILTCLQAGHPANWVGTVTAIEHKICKDTDTSETKIKIVSDTCKAPVINASVIEEVCVEGQFGETYTRACPDGDQEGAITMRMARQCPSGNIGEVQISNSCVCVPSKDLGNVTKACPTGQYGSIVVNQVRSCIDSSVKEVYGRKPVITSGGNTCPCPATIKSSYSRESVGSAKKSKAVKQTTVSTNTCACPVVKDIETCQCTVIETEVSNSCKTCVPSSRYTDTACPADYSGHVRTTTTHVCDGSNGGAGRDVVTTDKQCHLTCTPSSSHKDATCPDRYEGYIRTTTAHVCDGSNEGKGRDVVTTDKQCRPTCTPSSSHTDATCPDRYEGYIRTTTAHVCDGSNDGFGRDEVTTDNQCRPSCTPSSSSSDATCPDRYEGYIRTTTAHVCDGSNGGFGRDVVTTDNQCRPTCTPSSSHTDATCPTGYEGYIRTTTAHVCDGSNGGFGRDIVTTDNQCRPTCTPSSTNSDAACPAGYEGYIRTTTAHVCDGSSGGAGRDVVTTDNQCRPICTPTSSTSDAACPAGFEGYVRTTTAHVCDGSNGGFGRDVVTSNNLCTPISSGDGGGDGGGGQSGDGGGGAGGGGDGGGCPLVFDFDNGGLEAIALRGSNVFFDIDNDGTKDQTAWISAKEGFLVYDRNKNGIIDNRSEMFGDMEGATNGFEHLSSYETIKDGVFDIKDALFSEVKVWRDANVDGISQPEELVTLKSLGISEIKLDFKNINDSDKGQVISQKSLFKYEDGRVGEIFDIWFKYIKNILK